MRIKRAILIITFILLFLIISIPLATLIACQNKTSTILAENNLENLEQTYDYFVSNLPLEQSSLQDIQNFIEDHELDCTNISSANRFLVEDNPTITFDSTLSCKIEITTHGYYLEGSNVLYECVDLLLTEPTLRVEFLLNENNLQDILLNVSRTFL